MFLDWNAEAAKKETEKYEKRLEKAELKDILKAIKDASYKGYTGIQWRGKIKEKNLYKLKKYGYKISSITHYISKIEW